MHDIESSPKPDDSPPPYTLMDESGNQGASSSAPPGGPPNTIVVTPPSPVNGSRPISPSQRQVQLFGPTPLQQSQPLLIPYYDPHSPYSLSQADSRTRWRFIGAVLWTVVLCVIFSGICVAWDQGFRFDWERNWPAFGEGLLLQGLIHFVGSLGLWSPFFLSARLGLRSHLCSEVLEPA
ncbi:hypothetical protein AB1N83_005768 [Pleurotus pulmonarius]